MQSTNQMVTQATRRTEFLAGAKATLPLILGAIPFGIIFGALSVSNGLSPAATMSMSMFVFAGSAQFIAAGLVDVGASVGFIILTTFVVNLRHALYGISLAPYMKRLSHKWLLPLGFWLTDESYAVAISRFLSEDKDHVDSNSHWFVFGSSVAMYANWQLCTLIGIVAGQSMENATEWGLDFAMAATFIGIVVPLIKTRPMLVATLVAGVSALLFHDLPNQLGLMVASLLGIVAGYVAEGLQQAEGLQHNHISVGTRHSSSDKQGEDQ
jgi:4-azaleucine resistance transporter AzlC